MTFKVILPITGSTDRGGVRDLLLQYYKLDFTTLLELALEHWNEINHGDDEGLEIALGEFLNRRLPRRRPMSFAEFCSAIATLSSAVQQLHAHFHPALSTLLECKCMHGEADIRLVGWACKSPVIEIRSR